MNSLPELSLKKSYQRPGIKVYGSIEALTALVSNNSPTNDSGAGAMQKTH